MKTIVTAMAALLAFGFTASTAGAQQYPYYGNQSGTWNQNGYPAQCNVNGNSRHRHRDRDRDRDDGNGNGNYNNGNYNKGNYNTGNYNTGNYNTGNYNNGYYGNNGSYANNPYYNNGNGNRRYTGSDQCAGNSSASIRGSIVGINGNQVTLQTQNNRTVTIDDQPALDRQASGRVAVGRYLTAYGYWNNGVFYATQLV